MGMMSNKTIKIRLQICFYFILKEEQRFYPKELMYFPDLTFCLSVHLIVYFSCKCIFYNCTLFFTLIKKLYFELRL